MSRSGLRRWPWSLIAVVLALVGVPLTLVGSSAVNAAWGNLAGNVLQVFPPLAVGIAAVWCARAGLRQAREQARMRRPAIVAAVVAYIMLGLMIALLLFILWAMGSGSGG